MESTAILNSFFESDAMMMSVSELLIGVDDGVFVTVNAACARNFNRAPEQITGLRWSEAGINLETRRLLIQHCLETAQSGKPSQFEGCRERDAEIYCYQATAYAIKTPPGMSMRFTCVVEDITARKQAELDLRRSQERQRGLIDCMPAMIGHVGADRRYLYCNKYYYEFCGQTEESIIGKNVTEVLGEDAFAWMQPFIDRVLAGEHLSYEMPITRPEMDTRYLLITYSPELNASGDVAGYFFSAIDITIRKELEQERETLLRQTEGLLEQAVEKADADPLTSLLNHRAFHKRLEEEADRCLRSGTSMAVAVMDLDNFKFFNDAYGHAAGDQVLREVACALLGSCRTYDVLARFGGDEFAMLLPGVEIDGPASEAAATEAIARKLCEAMAEVGFRPPNADFAVPILISAGVALFPNECATRADVLELADSRLSRSKLGQGDEEQTPAERLSAELTSSSHGFAMLNALVVAVDTKDRYTRRHSEDVMRYSVEIARELGLPEEELKTIATAALLHDVGKIGVPDKILRKPGKLAEAELDAVRQHAAMGAAIVAAEPDLSETLGAVRHHHERWDGAGYPDNLAGEAIPLHARIMAVADAFSAMTTDRPYRQSMQPEKALEILKNGAGTQWDPACVDAFCRAAASQGPLLTAPRPHCKPAVPALAALPPAQNFRFSAESDGRGYGSNDYGGGEVILPD